MHEVGTNTAGFSPVDDNGTEVCAGIVIELDGGVVGEGDGLADAGGGVADADGGALGAGDVAGASGGDAFRLPACLPTKNAATQSPIRTTNPATARLRLLDGVIELT